VDELRFLGSYSGETLDQLIALEGQYRIDSIVLAVEQALSRKDQLTEAELTVLAVEALEREVNNGGFDQFFGNSSRQYAPSVVDAPKRIGCPKTAALAQKAIDALGISGGDLSPATIEAVMEEDDDNRTEMLDGCDSVYYEGEEEPIAEKLYAYIKANREHIALGQ